jgi:hypothetical protein
MALLKIQNAKVIISGKTLVEASPSQELINTIQYNGENIEFDGEILTFIEN